MKDTWDFARRFSGLLLIAGCLSARDAIFITGPFGPTNGELLAYRDCRREFSFDECAFKFPTEVFILHFDLTQGGRFERIVRLPARDLHVTGVPGQGDFENK